MRKAFIVALSLATALVMTGCTLFYPNSGTPTDEVIDPTASSAEVPGEATSPEDATSPSTSTSASPSPSVSPTMAPAVFFIQEFDASSGSLYVRAEVTNFVEDGGSCTLSYYQGATATAIATVKAERNITSTQCFPFDINFSAVPKGSIALTVSYKSDNHIGESAKFEVNIP